MHSGRVPKTIKTQGCEGKDSPLKESRSSYLIDI